MPWHVDHGRFAERWLGCASAMAVGEGQPVAILVPILSFMREGAWTQSVPALPEKLPLAWAGPEAAEKKPFF